MNRKSKIIIASITTAMIIAGGIFVFVFSRPSEKTKLTADIQNSLPNVPEVSLEDQLNYKNEIIPLLWTDDNTGENLIIKSDRKYYDGRDSSEVFFSITNISDKDQKPDIKFLFDEKEGRGTKEIALLNSQNDVIAVGQTNFYKAVIYYPQNSKGEFFIEAKGDKGGYGYLDPYYASGLVGMWSFSGKDTTWTSVTAGTTNDLSGNNNTGTMTNMSQTTSPVAGISGQALNFDGVDDYVNVGTGSSLDITGPITISAWIYEKGFGAEQIIFIRNQRSDAMYSQYYLIMNEAGELGFTITDGITLTSVGGWSATIPTVNQWNYVTALWDGTTNANSLKLYINGILKDSTQSAISSIWSQNVAAFIGADYLGGEPTPRYIFNGLIDEVRIYNRALSASEITDLYRVGAARMKVNAPKTLAGPKGGLVGNWSFNGQDMAGAVTSAGGNLLREGFEGTGYENAGWTEVVAAGATLDEDSAGPGTLPLGGGSQSLYAVTTGADYGNTRAQYNLGSNYTTAYVRVYVYIGSEALVNGSDRQIIYWKTTEETDDTGISLRQTAEGNLIFRALFVGGNIDSDPLSVGQWYRVEFKWVQNGTGEMKIDGVSKGTATCQNNPLGMILVGTMDNGYNYHVGVYFDLVAVDSSNWIGAEMLAVDRSGNNNNGYVLGGASVTPGISGQALNFDGVDDYVSITDSSSLRPSAVTVAVWLKRNGSQILYAQPVGKNSDPTLGYNSYAFAFYSDNTVVEWSLGYAPGSQVLVVSTSGSVPDGVWTFLVGTYDGTTARLYVNGREDPNSPTVDARTILYNSDPLYIGTYDTATQFFKGLIDEVRIYNRALSAGEITDLYKIGAARMKVNTPKTLAGPKGGLVGNWSFNGPDVNWVTGTAYDRSGSGNNGTITNMSTTTSPVPGISGQALKFDGVNNYVMKSSPSWDFTGNPTNTFSISAWFNPKSCVTLSGIALNSSLGSGVLRLFCYVSTPNVWEIQLLGGSTVSMGGTVKLNEWQHVVGVYNASETKMYLYYNGSLVDSDVPAITDTSAWADGIQIGNAQTYFNGLIDEVRIYNRALSASEITDLYKIGAARVKIKQ